MASCKHAGWLRVIENRDSKELIIERTDRLGALVREMPDPDFQRPQLCLFLGTSTKDEAMRNIFNRNNIRRGDRANVNLRVDTASLTSDNPVLFADSNPFQVPLSEKTHVWCHETTSHSTAWHTTASRAVIDVLYSRLVFTFSDVICIFADDFQTLEAIMLRLIAWVEVQNASSLPSDTRPRLLIILSEDGKFSEARTEDYLASSNLGRQLSSSFSTFKIFQLAGKYLSPSTRYQRLHAEIRYHMEESRAIKSSLRCLFSATHLLHFFNSAVKHTAHNPGEVFDFIKVARDADPVKADHHVYLQKFLKLCVHFKISYNMVAAFVASSIMMNAYPKRMHRLIAIRHFNSLMGHNALPIWIEGFKLSVTVYSRL
ncbi:hypothetical protein N7497_011323 [Penicillium chrysogenum]|nr:hypothetical protein N7497_011323 [Penicillium chrysogenum]